MKTIVQKPEVWITVVYLISGVSWIFFSDGLLAEVAVTTGLDSKLVQAIQSWKGVFYVFLTGVILYFSLHGYFGRLNRAVFDAQELFEQSPNAMMVFDIETRTFVQANETASRKYGYSLKEFEGMPVTMLRPKEEHHLIEETFQLVSSKLKGEGEWNHQLKDGRIITNQAFWSTIDYKGKNCRIFTFIDITEKKEKERKLRLQENKQQALINNTKDQIWSLDRNFRLLSFNHSFWLAANRMFGIQLSVGDIPFQEGKALISIEMWKSLFQKAFDGDSFSTEMEAVYPTGEKFFLEVSFNPIFTDTDEIEGACCFIHDITKRKERENIVLNQLKQLREIAWIQSHKVRAPVANILGLAEMLKNSNEKEREAELNEMLQMILFSAEQLDDIIAEVVKLSHKIEVEHPTVSK